ncbi:hypothetical protein [Pleionea sediminis]|uniref:hypothetical protein n=1 Tax=Pleionea sediminis TaxID=2569479 RepID=UPI001185CCF1|nr:hypothetical protein [Pleionea sediminis]
MKQFARFVSLSAVVFFSGVSLNTQALDLNTQSFESNIELQLTRLKAEALISVKYEIKNQLKAPKSLILGEVAKPKAMKNQLAQNTNVLNNLENLAE